MKKFKLEFDYKLSDCVGIVLQCAIATLIFAGGGGFIMGFLFSVGIHWLGIIPAILGYLISGVYTIICISRYIIEGITIKQIEN